MAKRSLTHPTARLLFGLVVATGWSEPVRAQSDPRLVSIVKLAQDGFADSARGMIRRLVETTEPTDSTYGEILYTSGLVAGTDSERRLTLRRLVIEYSQSAWADDALLLVGQTEYASGNLAGAVAQIDRLVRDYPTSPLIAAAALWGARAAADLRDAATTCRFADAGLAAPNVDVELRNQLEYQKQRCSGLASIEEDSVVAAGPTPTDTARADSSTPAAPLPAPRAGPAGRFRVQVIAAPTRAKAAETVASLQPLGFPTLVVEEGGYFKVRAGPFATRPEADAALRRIRSRLGGKPFIVVDR